MPTHSHRQRVDKALGNLFAAEGERARVANAMEDLTGVVLADSRANFLFATLSYPAAALCAWMLERKILLRNCRGDPGIDGECVRFAIRRREDNDRLMAAWKSASVVRVT